MIMFTGDVRDKLLIVCCVHHSTNAQKSRMTFPSASGVVKCGQVLGKIEQYARLGVSDACDDRGSCGARDRGVRIEGSALV